MVIQVRKTMIRTHRAYRRRASPAARLPYPRLQLLGRLGIVALSSAWLRAPPNAYRGHPWRLARLPVHLTLFAGAQRRWRWLDLRPRRAHAAMRPLLPRYGLRCPRTHALQDRRASSVRVSLLPVTPLRRIALPRGRRHVSVGARPATSPIADNPRTDRRSLCHPGRELRVETRSRR